MTSFESEINPLLTEWNTPYQLPPFSEIKPSHYRSALLDHAFPQHLEDLRLIVESPDSLSLSPSSSSLSLSFQNTIAAFDRAGLLAQKILAVFSNQCSSECPPELQAVQLELSAPLAEHESNVATFPGLYPKIAAIFEARYDLDLNPEQIRLTERIHLDFVRAGARFDPSAQARYKEILMELAVLTTQFAQNVLADESSFFLEIKADELDGMPDDLIAAAKQAAFERNIDGYGITVSRSLVEPFLTYSSHRGNREKAWKAWINRGQLDPTRDNSSVILKILTLREEQAKMHGYKNYAEYSTADSMATNPRAVMDLLMKVWKPAKIACNREKEMIQEYITTNCDPSFPVSLEPWDWRYYAEKIRVQKYDFDSSLLKPYFSLTQVTRALFDCAKQLFNLDFVLVSNIPSYHPDVQTYEVREQNPVTGEQQLYAIFIHDNFSRTNKQSGAWMSSYRSQTRNCLPSTCASIMRTDGSVIPIIVNNNNFSKAPDGQETLLSYDDCRTLFHEFGHGLHGMLSNVTYSSLAGTNVLRDFVELPSQLFEHWIEHPTVLSKYAKHYQTGEIIPSEMLEKLNLSRNFQSGFATVEYLSCALYDQYLHQLPTAQLLPEGQIENTSFNINSVEEKFLESVEMPRGMVLRHRSTHFLHLFASSAYAAGYYVYLWAEVLDSDGFDAFVEAGDVFDKETAERLKKYIYSSGNSLEPGEAYRLFRGRDPVVAPMLKKKGLYSEGME